MEEEINQEGFPTFFKYHWRGIFHIVSFLILLPFNFQDFSKARGIEFLHQLMFFWFAADVLPPGVTAVLPIIILPLLGIISSEDVCRSYGMGYTMTFMLSYFISLAFENTRTSLLMAYNWISVFSYKPRFLLTTVMFASWTLSTILPDPVVCSLMLPLSKSIVQILESLHIGALYENNYIYKNDQFPEPTSLTKGFGLGVAYSVTIGGMATLIGSDVGDTLYTEYHKLLPNATGQITFSSYLILGIPFSLSVFICTLFYLQLVYLGFLREYSTENLTYNNETCTKILKDALSAKPSYNINQVITIISWILLAVLCFLAKPQIVENFNVYGNKSYMNYTTVCAFICLLILLTPSSYEFLNYFICKQPLMYQPTSGILNWQIIRSNTAWDYIIVYGSSMVLALSWKKTHYHIKISKTVINKHTLLERTTYIFESALLSIMGANHFVAEFFIHAAVHYSLLTNFHPGNMLYSIAFGSSISFFLPLSSISNCFACGWFYIKPKTLMFASLGPTFSGIIIAMFVVSQILPQVHPEYDYPPYAN